MEDRAHNHNVMDEHLQCHLERSKVVGTWKAKRLTNLLQFVEALHNCKKVCNNFVYDIGGYGWAHLSQKCCYHFSNIKNCVQPPQTAGEHVVQSTVAGSWSSHQCYTLHSLVPRPEKERERVWRPLIAHVHNYPH